MTPTQEFLLGTVLWAGGLGVALGVALATPFNQTELSLIGVLVAVIGITLIYCGLQDLAGDSFEEEIKESYKQEKKK